MCMKAQIIVALSIFILVLSGCQYIENGVTKTKDFNPFSDSSTDITNKKCEKAVDDFINKYDTLYLYPWSYFTCKEGNIVEPPFPGYYHIISSYTTYQERLEQPKVEEFSVISCRQGEEVGQNVNYYYCSNQIEIPDTLDKDGNIIEKGSTQWYNIVIEKPILHDLIKTSQPVGGGCSVRYDYVLKTKIIGFSC